MPEPRLTDMLMLAMRLQRLVRRERPHLDVKLLLNTASLKLTIGQKEQVFGVQQPWIAYRAGNRLADIERQFLRLIDELEAQAGDQGADRAWETAAPLLQLQLTHLSWVGAVHDQATAWGATPEEQGLVFREWGLGLVSRPIINLRMLSLGVMVPHVARWGVSTEEIWARATANARAWHSANRPYKDATIRGVRYRAWRGSSGLDGSRLAFPDLCGDWSPGRVILSCAPHRDAFQLAEVDGERLTGDGIPILVAAMMQGALGSGETSYPLLGTKVLLREGDRWIDMAGV